MRHIIWEPLAPSSDDDLFSSPERIRVRGSGTIHADILSYDTRLSGVTIPVRDGQIIALGDDRLYGPGLGLARLLPATNVVVEQQVEVCEGCGPLGEATEADGEPVYCIDCSATRETR